MTLIKGLNTMLDVVETQLMFITALTLTTPVLLEDSDTELVIISTASTA